jgi:NitT/TauT family transport system permease protein
MTRAHNRILRYLAVLAFLTDIFAGLKLTVGFALAGAIVDEFMPSADGLGVRSSKRAVSIISKVFAGLAFAMSLALALSYAVRPVERMLLPRRYDLRV